MASPPRTGSLPASTRGRLIVHGPVTYNADGMATKHQAAFLRDRRFKAAYEAGKDIVRRHEPDLAIEWRVHICGWVGEMALGLPGDILGLGLGTAVQVRALAALVDIDAHAGHRIILAPELPPARPGEAATTKTGPWEGGGYEELGARVREGLGNVSSLDLLEPQPIESMGRMPVDRIAGMISALDQPAAELSVLEQLWDRMSPRAPLLLERHGLSDRRGRMGPLESFLRERGVHLMHLPTGQALGMVPDAD